jgi:hypothetical protein
MKIIRYLIFVILFKGPNMLKVITVNSTQFTSMDKFRVSLLIILDLMNSRVILLFGFQAWTIRFIDTLFEQISSAAMDNRPTDYKWKKRLILNI